MGSSEGIAPAMQALVLGSQKDSFMFYASFVGLLYKKLTRPEFLDIRLKCPYGDGDMGAVV